MHIKTQKLLVYLILLVILLYFISCDQFTSRQSLANKEMKDFANLRKKLALIIYMSLTFS